MTSASSGTSGISGLYRPRPAACTPGRTDEDLARDWLDRGPALVVVTRGAHGAFAVTSEQSVHQPSEPIDLVDTVGVGAAFMAGLFDALGRADLLGGARRPSSAAVDEPTPAHVLSTAALVAAITCSRPDADPPTRAEPVRR